MSTSRMNLCLTVCAMVLGAAAVSCSRSGIRLEPLREPLPTASDFRLRPEHWGEPKVSALRKQENLDEVLIGAEGELDRFLRLMGWARAQWPPGDPDPYPPSNGIDILSAIRSGQTGGFCGQYAYLLADALKSFGYFSVRFIEMESAAGEPHFALEAWSNEHNRWVLLDPTYNLYYVGPGGEPLGALEVHDALRVGRPSDARAVAGKVPDDGGRRASDLPDGGPGLFHRVAVSVRSDLAHLSSAPTIADRERMFVRFDGSPDAAFRHLSFVRSTTRREDLYPGVAQVEIMPVDVSSDRVTVEFRTHGSLPYFLAYEVRLDEGSWTRTGHGVEWTVPPGEHTLEVRAVNVAGIPGPVFGLRAVRVG